MNLPKFIPMRLEDYKRDLEEINGQTLTCLDIIVASNMPVESEAFNNIHEGRALGEPLDFFPGVYKYAVDENE